MYDVISVLFVLGFFALGFLYVQGCDRILGRDELEVVPGAGADPRADDEAVAA